MRSGLVNVMNKTVLVIVGLIVLLGIGGGAFYVMNNKTAENSKMINQEDKMMVQPTVKVEPTAMMEEKPVVTNGVRKTFVVEGANYKFSPNNIVVNVGDTVEITFKNSQGSHDFVIDEFEIATNQIGEGEEETVEFVVDKKGTFEFYCSVGQHRANGMVGKLVVQ